MRDTKRNRAAVPLLSFVICTHAHTHVRVCLYPAGYLHAHSQFAHTHMRAHMCIWSPAHFSVVLFSFYSHYCVKEEEAIPLQMNVQLECRAVKNSQRQIRVRANCRLPQLEVCIHMFNICVYASVHLNVCALCIRAYVCMCLYLLYYYIHFIFCRCRLCCCRSASRWCAARSRFLRA